MFNLPSNPQLRHWKIRLPNGTWKSLKRTIKNESELLKALKKEGDWQKMDIYYSTSCFLDPENIKEKNTHDILIYSNFVLDIDATDPEEARHKALTVYNMMSINGYECQQIVFSGSKGYHLYYDICGNQLRDIAPYSRFKALNALYYEVLRKTCLIDEPLLAGLIDKDTTLDAYRVIRLPGSINQKSGLKCRIITETELKKPAIASCSDIVGNRKEAHEANPPRQPDKVCGQTGISPRPTFISNRVSGTKDLYILFLKYPIKMDYLRILRKLKRVLAEYEMPDIYAFKNDKWYYFVCLETYQPRKLMKVLGKCNSENNSLLSYFPVNCTFIETIHGNRQRNLWLSKAHYKLYSILTKAGEDKERKLCGEMKVGVMNPDG